MSRAIGLRLILACAFGFTTQAGALTLDWSATGTTWTNPTSFTSNQSASNTYSVAGGIGSDVTVALSGNTAQFGNSTPAINANLQGGFGTAPSALNLYVDFTSQTQAINVSVSFAAAYTQGVSGVSFTLFDVDGLNTSSTNSFQDKLSSIIGIAPDGSQVPASIGLTSTGGTTGVTGNNTVGAVVLGSGNSPNTATNGTGTDAGNVTITFNSPVKSFSYIYGSGTNTVANPSAQQISMYNLSFTPVPEMNPAWFGGLSCLAAGFLIRRHHARVRK